jgi:hypothetical protein
LVYFLIISEVGLAAAKAEEGVQPPKRVYVFYRGYHFLTGTDPLTDFSAGKGFHSRPVSNGEVKDVGGTIFKIARLHRPWTAAERLTFSPTCSTPYRELAQLYTNSYATFTAELKKRDSRTRRILRLEGVEVSANPFVSTSLLVHQAFRYGSGHKLYGIEDMRRYPDYKETGKPENKVVGYVDVYIMPETDYARYGIFDVVGNFATGATKLSYHYSKDLTAEEEFIFPLAIGGQFHVRRIPIRVPDFTESVPKGLYKGVWLRRIKGAKTEEERHAIEADLLSRLEDIEKARISKGVTLQLMMQGIRVVNSHPIIDGFKLSSLTPAEAKLLRRKIALLEDEIGHKYRDAASGKVAIVIKKQSRSLAWALRNFAERGDRVAIDFSVSLKEFDPTIMGIYLRNNNVGAVRFSGDRRHGVSLKGEFRNWVNWCLKPRHGITEETLDRYFVVPDKDAITTLLSAARGRTSPVIIDMGGIALHPALRSLLLDAENVTVAEDSLAKENAEAYWWTRKQVGIDEFDDEEEEQENIADLGLLGSMVVRHGAPGILSFLRAHDALRD